MNTSLLMLLLQPYWFTTAEIITTYKRNYLYIPSSHEVLVLSSIPKWIGCHSD